MTHAKMFLKIEVSGRGDIKGDAQHPTHKDEIEVFNFSWGIVNNHPFDHRGGYGQSPGTGTYKDFKIIKRVDGASTALARSVYNREFVKKAVLTVYRAGNPEVEYCKFVVEDALHHIVDGRDW